VSKGELFAKDEGVYSQIKAIVERFPRLTEADLDRLGQRGASRQLHQGSIPINRFHVARLVMLHLPEHISRVYRRRRDGLRDGFACSTCRRSRSNSSSRHMFACVLPKRVEYFSANLVSIHITSITDHNALLNSLLAWIRDRVRIKRACTSIY
jgi:hypothetical protein